MNTLWFKAKNMLVGSKFLAGNGSFIYPSLAYSMSSRSAACRSQSAL